MEKDNFENLNTCIEMEFQADISEYIGNIVPYPHKHNITHIYSYKWLIKGQFNTKKSIGFYNDIISRFYITFKSFGINHKRTTRTFKNECLTDLKHYQGLKSIVQSNKKSLFRQDRENKIDYVFWCLKDYAEVQINQKGIVTYIDLLEFGMEHFKDHKKGFSTIKAKCRSIVNYYINNDYRTYQYNKKYKTKKELEELQMTRQQNAVRVSKKKAEKTQNVIKTFLSAFPELLEEYKKKDGSWNVKKLSEALKISRPTVMKHLKELER